MSAGNLSALCRGQSRGSERVSRFAGLRRGHEVSILMTMVGAVGWMPWRGTALEDLMMIMRPPQHGQVGLPGSAAAAVGRPSGFATASNSRARAMWSAQALWRTGRSGDAVQALRQHVDEEAANELVGASVIISTLPNRKAQCEQMFSACPESGHRACSRHVRLCQFRK